MSENSIDLVVTSPPYDDLRTYGGASEWNFGIFKKTAKALARVLKSGGVIVWNVNDQVVNGGETGSSFRQALYFMDDCGLLLHDTMIYAKTGASFPAGDKSSRYTQVFEYVFVLAKGRPKTINLLRDKPNRWAGAQSWGKITSRARTGELVTADRKSKEIQEFGIRTNIWLINNNGGFGQTDKRAYAHPATMPEELARGHILSWSGEGDVVMDPFLGSGTTAVVAKQEGRDYVGFEINKEYFALARTRIDDARQRGVMLY